MTATHHLLQLVPNRARATVTRLKDKVWTRVRPLHLTATAPQAEHLGLAEIKDFPRTAVSKGESWGKLYDQRWFYLSQESLGETEGLYLEWRDDGEATLYVDEEPFYGFDPGHHYVGLPGGLKELWVEGYCVQSAIWHPECRGLSAEGALHTGAWLVKRDDEAWHAYHDLQCLFDLMIFERTRQHPSQSANLRVTGLQESLQRVTPRYRQLLRWLDVAIDALDREGIKAMRAVMAEAYADLKDVSSPVKGALIGHAHIDLVWLWTERVGEAKAVHTFSTTDRLMSLYPEFRFTYSQPASYDAVERRSPVLMKRVQKRISSGQWEPTGGLYVESDTLIACGEALSRSFVLGQEGFNRLRGEPSRLLWLPDVFGYSACLPQLMRQHGLDYFFTTKLTWSAINHFPYSSFIWRGNDGSEVVAHVTQGVGYNNVLTLDTINDNVEMHAQADVHREFIHPTGLGDGGGGVTEEMCERARRLSLLSGTPELEWDQPEAFFERLGGVKDKLPVWQGECYLEYHRGTYTTFTHLKSIFRKVERALQVREAMAALTGTNPDLTREWQKLVFAQFHDYIPGSSVPEVYQEDLPLMEEMADRLVEETAGAGEGATTVFNPHAQPWRGVWSDPSSGQLVAVDVPPFATVELSAVVCSVEAPVVVNERTVSNGRVSFTISEKGELTETKIDGRTLQLLPGAGLAMTAPDHPAHFEPWDIDRQALGLRTSVGQPEKIETFGESLRAGVRVFWRVGEQSSLTFTYSLDAGSSRIDVAVDVDWQEPQTLLQVAYPTAYRGQHARFGAPFGSVLRSQQPGPLSAEAQWEVPASRWATVSNDGEREGLFAVTEAKYGFSAKDGSLSLTLLRSPFATGFEIHDPCSPRGLSRHEFDSPYADIGSHTIRFALGFYDAGCERGAHPASLADTLYTQPMVVDAPPAKRGLLTLEGGESLVPAWIQPLGEEGYILRFHEVSGHSGEIRLILESGWNATAVDLRQEKLEGKKRGEDCFSYKPYEILSIKLLQNRKE